MSIHPSLGTAVKKQQQKSVLKRSERIKYLIKKDLWKEEDGVFGLPKIKTVRLKFKKEKAAEKPEEEAAVAETAESASTGTAEEKAKTTEKSKTTEKAKPAPKK